MAEGLTTPAPAGVMVRAEAGRPEGRLPLRMLLQLSVYWLGINSIWAALGVQALPNLLIAFVGKTDAPLYGAIQGVIGAIVAIAVQPTFGSISDYTISRWGRRKPFIAIGATFDVLFLIGIALADGFGVLLLFVVLLQFSSNLAQGPFQGYVPDLVPARQVGLASGLMGLMIVLGQAIGAGMIALSSTLAGQGIELNTKYGVGLVGVGVFELATALTTVLTVREGRTAKPRQGMSWLQVVRSVWGTDILAERSYLWLLASRLMILTGAALLLNVAQYFMQYSLGLSESEALGWGFVTTVVVAGMTALAVLPGGLLSDRIGRKRVIYIACLIAGTGLAIAATASSIEIAIGGALLLGLGGGTFLAVDWALMTDIIPKASSGRYMGISNVATGLGSGILPITLSGAIVFGTSIITGIDGAPLGPRLAIGLGIVLFALGALALRPVDPRRREDADSSIPTAIS